MKTMQMKISPHGASRTIPAVAGMLLLVAAPLFAQMNGSAQSGAAAQQQQQQNSSMTPGSTAGPSDNGGADTAAMQDKDFVKNALEGGMAEVQLGQLAAQKAASPDVRQFGQQMVADHTKLGDALKPAATQLGVKVPDQPSKKDRELMAKLQGLSGQQFDNAYIAAMVKDHKKDDSDFKMEAQQSQNPGLKQFAAQGDQMIQQHLAMIEQIGKAHNVVDDKGKAVNGD
ncbi:DUF4142 domain-containing protein [Silvibacterium sp.]|uniref:DUF4142 domain-containing protein n=1 Tax=Silvibacterium sp. TaxID=1964179 RepID=UPI0039E4076C